MAAAMDGFDSGALKDRLGYEGYLTFRVAALPEILQDGGYSTASGTHWTTNKRPWLARRKCGVPWWRTNTEIGHWLTG